MARISATTRAEVRARLLASAARQFAERGLVATNIDDVARRAGFGKGTVYNYFPSKEALFAAVIEEGCRRAVARWASVPRRGSTRDDLRALAAADVGVLVEDEGFTQVLVREALAFRPETYPLVVEHLAPYLAAVERVLLDGRERAEIRDDVAASELALGFVGFLTLLYVQHWGSGGAWPSLEQVPELAVTLFLDGAGAPATDSGSSA
jgi:AcrR family transcriptional regulator